MNIEVTEVFEDNIYEEIKVHNCDHCGKSFTNAGNLKTHVNSVHEGVENHKSFAQAEDLQTYKKAVHENHNCNQCGKSFSREGNLKKHIKIVHGRQNDYKCETCGKEFAYLKNFKSHVKSVHKGVKDHRCDNCGEYFTSAIFLKLHNEFHEHVKYKCTYCKIDFIDFECLKIHVKSVHERTKCILCENFCIDILTHNCSVLLSWNQVLTGQNNDFQNECYRHCKICNIYFYQKIEWMQHIKSVHEG